MCSKLHCSLLNGGRHCRRHGFLKGSVKYFALPSLTQRSRCLVQISLAHFIEVQDGSEVETAHRVCPEVLIKGKWEHDLGHACSSAEASGPCPTVVHENAVSAALRQKPRVLKRDVDVQCSADRTRWGEHWGSHLTTHGTFKWASNR